MQKESEGREKARARPRRIVLATFGVYWALSKKVARFFANLL